MPPSLARGDVVLLDLDPTRGHEQAGKRPCLVISVDEFNQGPAGLIVALPITSKEKKVPFHVEVLPPEGGLTSRSFVKCEDIRSVSIERVVAKWGSVTPRTRQAVEDRLRILLGL